MCRMLLAVRAACPMEDLGWAGRLVPVCDGPASVGWACRLLGRQWLCGPGRLVQCAALFCTYPTVAFRAALARVKLYPAACNCRIFAWHWRALRVLRPGWVLGANVMATTYFGVAPLLGFSGGPKAMTLQGESSECGYGTRVRIRCSSVRTRCSPRASMWNIAMNAGAKSSVLGCRIRGILNAWVSAEIGGAPPVSQAIRFPSFVV